jgi:hypothetical protein
MKFNKKTVALVLSIVLNIAGGFGIVPPVTGEPPACPECERCGATEVDSNG